MTNEQRPSDEVLSNTSLNCLYLIQYLEDLDEILEKERILSPDLNNYLEGSIVVVNLLKKRILEKVPQ